jgi:hypothetical protein
LGGGVGVQAAPVKGSTQGAVWAATGAGLNAGMRIAARKTIMKTADKDITEPRFLFPIFLSLVMSMKYI